MSTSPSPTRRSSRLLPALFVSGAATTLLSLLPLRAWESWWHLQMGRVVASFHAVPNANHFAFALPKEAPALLQSWLGDLWLFHISEAMGLEGAVMARNLSFFLAILLITSAPRALSVPRRLALGALAAALLLGATFTTPTLFAAPLFALCVWAMVRTRDTTRRAALIAAMILPVGVSALWANLDIAYGLVALLTAYAALRALNDRGRAEDEDNKKFERLRLIGWSLATLGCLLTPLLNPRGVAIVPHTLEVLRRYPMHPDAPLWRHLFALDTLPTLLMVLLATVGITISARRRGARRAWPELLLAALLVLFACTHLRAVTWLGLALPLLLDLPTQAPTTDEKPPLYNSFPLQLTAALLALFGVLLTQPIFLWRAELMPSLQAPLHLRAAPPHQYVITEDVPVEAVELMAQQLGTPRVWASRPYEGYLQYRLLEAGEVAQVTYTDPRHELYDEKITNLRQMLRDDPDLWRGIFQGFGIDAALLSREQDGALIERLHAHPDWMLAHDSPHYAYFVHVQRDAR